MSQKERPRPQGGANFTESEIKAIKRKFLIKYSRTGVMTYSAEEAGTTPKTIRKWLAKDAKFAKKFEEMQEKFVDTLEIVAVQRAIEKSDSLLITLLKANRAEKYRENVKMDADVTERKTVKLVFSRDEVSEDMPNYAHISGNDGGGKHGDAERTEEEES